MKVACLEYFMHTFIVMILICINCEVLLFCFQVFTFGRNYEGQLCTGNLADKNIPVVVKALTTKPMVSSSHLQYDYCKYLHTYTHTNMHTYII